MQKVISGFGEAGVWLLSPKMFTGFSFETVQQTIDMVLQIGEHEEILKYRHNFKI
jgi:hypothetical protein